MTLHARHVENRFRLRDRIVAAVDRGTHRPPNQIANLIDSFSMHQLDVLATSIHEKPCSRETWNEVASVFRNRARAVAAFDGTGMAEWSDGKVGRS